MPGNGTGPSRYSAAGEDIWTGRSVLPSRQRLAGGGGLCDRRPLLRHAADFDPRMKYTWPFIYALSTIRPGRGSRAGRRAMLADEASHRPTSSLQRPRSIFIVHRPMDGPTGRRSFERLVAVLERTLAESTP